MDPGAEHADDAAQPLRSDAERNRARIVAAARLVFGRGGLNDSPGPDALYVAMLRVSRRASAARL